MCELDRVTGCKGSADVLWKDVITDQQSIAGVWTWSGDSREEEGEQGGFGEFHAVWRLAVAKGRGLQGLALLTAGCGQIRNVSAVAPLKCG